jgi:hypothetical protein
VLGKCACCISSVRLAGSVYPVRLNDGGGSASGPAILDAYCHESPKLVIPTGSYDCPNGLVSLWFGQSNKLSVILIDWHSSSARASSALGLHQVRYHEAEHSSQSELAPFGGALFREMAHRTQEDHSWGILRSKLADVGQSL